MTKVNIVFDNFYDDADIIAVPDEIIKKLPELAQDYLNWIPPETDTESWVFTNGKKCLNKETVGFIKWLNQNCCANLNKAYIISQNTAYNAEYPIIEF